MTTSVRLSRGRTILALFALIAGFWVSFDAPAIAYCVYPSTSDPLTIFWGKETTPNVNTCDGDGIYNGKVFDLYTDQSCVWVQFKEGTTVYTQATSCNSSGISYTFYDQNNNNWSLIRICRNQGCYPTSTWASTQSY